MTIIACVDDKYGMMFNGRRQSMDRAVRERMLELTRDKLLWMSPYSAGQFDPLPAQVRIHDDFLENGRVCFVEDRDPGPWIPHCSRIILYRWNRVYPADRYFPIQLLKLWRMTDSREFAGHSHERITEEIYEIQK